MKRYVLALAVLGLVAVVGCSGDDASPYFADIQWQVSCHAAGGCSGLPARDINHLSGERGHRVSCTLGGTPAMRVLTFQAFQDDPSRDPDDMSDRPYGIEMRNAVFNSAGSLVAGTGCTVRVLEDNDYVGACGSAPIADGCNDNPTLTSTPCDQPCMVTSITLGSDTDGNPQIQGNILCHGLPNQSDLAREREVHFPGGDDTMPFTFRLVNCSGL